MLADIRAAHHHQGTRARRTACCSARPSPLLFHDEPCGTVIKASRECASIVRLPPRLTRRNETRGGSRYACCRLSRGGPGTAGFGAAGTAGRRPGGIGHRGRAVLGGRALGIGGGAVFQDAGQQLDRDQSTMAGHPAMTRLIVPMSAVAMLAARLAAVQVVRASQGSQPHLGTARRSASRTRDATISTPSTALRSAVDKAHRRGDK